MRYGVAAILVGVGLMMSGCNLPRALDSTGRSAPQARREPHRLEKHGHERIDDYYWLNDRDDAEVLRYLEAENRYTKRVMAHTEQLQKTLFDEMVGRIKKNDASVPYKLRDYYYYDRYVGQGEYPIHARKRGSLEADEEVMLDVNELARGHDYFAARGLAVSSGQNILAFATDTVGRRVYTIRFKDLETGEMLPDEIPDVTSNLTWAEDNTTLFYAKQDPTTLRFDRIYRHRLGTDASQDELVHEETDDTFSCFVFKTKSRAFLMIASVQTLSTEYRYLRADRPADQFTVLHPRERKHEYSVDHYGDHFYIRTNHRARNFRLMKTPIGQTGKQHWRELIPNRGDVLLEDFEIFSDFLVIEERRDGLIRLRVRPWSGADEHYLDFGEPAYAAYVDKNPEIESAVLRYAYTSMTTPRSVYDYDMRTRRKELKKRDEVLGGFDSANYRTERLHAKARGGVRIPISLVYHKDSPPSRKSPLLLYGYGSYGFSIDAAFQSERLSLLDRGFVFAIAHVRGGEELGRAWYEDGKLLRKKNTFTDFIDCAEYLIKQKYTHRQRLFAYGGSAGGLLIGAVINLKPQLFHGAVASVPFVDVVTTMLDESIPLTTSEYDEWGDPNDKQYYDYMLSYSPYDNVQARDYPHLLVLTGLHDSQVQYWEPAKWVAKLRALKIDDNRLLLQTNMDAGHSGASGRFRRYRERALAFAFLLDLAGVSG